MRLPLSVSKRMKVFNRDGFKCIYCGRKAPDVELEVDHKIPVAKGGTDDITNLVTSCKECNRGKSAKNISVEIKDILVGKFFLSFYKESEVKEEGVEVKYIGTPKRQGVVLGKVGNDAYLIETYSWLDGTTYDNKIVYLQEMKDWSFFEDDFSMRYYSWGKSRQITGATCEDFENQEKYIRECRKKTDSESP